MLTAYVRTAGRGAGSAASAASIQVVSNAPDPAWPDVPERAPPIPDLPLPRSRGAKAAPVEADAEAGPADELVWLDLLDPTPAEIERATELLGVRIPSRAAVQEIEASSRLFEEAGARYMTFAIVYKGDTDAPVAPAVTAILAGQMLVTLRFDDPLPFRTFAERLRAHPGTADSPDRLMIGLLETVIDRTADLLEKAGGQLDLVAEEVFTHAEIVRGRGRGASALRRHGPDLRAALRRIGTAGELNSRVQESLLTINRLLSFYSLGLEEREKKSKDQRTRLKTLTRDMRSLVEHSSFLSGRITLLLDATLGMLSIEQNAIIKIFSVAAVIFLPPTLVASIYGMNFKHMPEVDWLFGYPLALLLMLGSAVGFYSFFKGRGWL